VVINAAAKEYGQRTHFQECPEKCAQKQFDKSDIVRDVRYFAIRLSDRSMIVSEDSIRVAYHPEIGPNSQYKRVRTKPPGGRRYA